MCAGLRDSARIEVKGGVTLGAKWALEARVCVKAKQRGARAVGRGRERIGRVRRSRTRARERGIVVPRDALSAAEKTGVEHGAFASANRKERK